MANAKQPESGIWNRMDLLSPSSLAGLTFGMAPHPLGCPHIIQLVVLSFQTTVKLCSSFSVLKGREECNIFSAKRLTFNKNF